MAARESPGRQPGACVEAEHQLPKLVYAGSIPVIGSTVLAGQSKFLRHAVRCQGDVLPHCSRTICVFCADGRVIPFAARPELWTNVRLYALDA